VPNQVKNINVLEVARGAIMEQIEIEMKKIIENLNDPNTDWKAVRELGIKLSFKNTDERRQTVQMAGQAKAKLTPNTPIGTLIYTELTTSGVVAVELNKPDPNQISIDEEQGMATTNIIKMRKAGGQ
jgi:hypothetical protein